MQHCIHEHNSYYVSSENAGCGTASGSTSDLYGTCDGNGAHTHTIIFNGNNYISSSSGGHDHTQFYVSSESSGCSDYVTSSTNNFGTCDGNGAHTHTFEIEGINYTTTSEGSHDHSRHYLSGSSSGCGEWTSGANSFGTCDGLGNHVHALEIITNPDGCVYPTDGMVITQNTTFCTGTYNLPNGVKIWATNINLNCNGAVLVGNNFNSIGGINVRDIGGLSIQNCFLTNYYHGIYLFHSSNNRIFNNKVSNCFDGFYLYSDSNNNSLFNNNLNDNRQGIRVYIANRNFIYNNSLENGTYGVSLIVGEYNSILDIKISNLNGQGIFLNGNQYTIIMTNNLFNNSIAIYVRDSSNISVKNNKLFGNNYGIWTTSNSIGNDISFNYLFSNLYGIRVEDKENIISDNYLDGNHRGYSGALSGRGIEIKSNNNIIKNNNLVNHVSIAIYANDISSQGVLILNNTIDESQRECMLVAGINQSIINNTIKNCVWEGLYPAFNNSFVKGNLFSNSKEGIRSWVQMSNNIFTENTFINNSMYAITMYSYNGRISKNNTFFLNKFVNSGNKHVYYTSDVINNKWDNGEVGNCWDDFKLNLGYPNYYVVSDKEDGIDWHPINCFVEDEDNDGVLDIDDKCSNTIDEQLVYGCSCVQILDLKPGEDTGELRNGCSEGTLKVFEEAKGWAKDLFG